MHVVGLDQGRAMQDNARRRIAHRPYSRDQDVHGLAGEAAQTEGLQRGQAAQQPHPTRTTGQRRDPALLPAIDRSGMRHVDPAVRCLPAT
jgi:hypothetical protein